MKESTKNVYRKYLIVYIKKVNPDEKPNEKKLILCPYNCSKEPSAQIHHHKISCYEPSCKKETDIFKYVQLKKESFKEKSDDEIAEYLRFLLKIELKDHTELLNWYASMGFCLIPIAPDTKRPTIKWKEKYYKNPQIWEDWLDRGWGLAIVLGEESGVDAVDIDSMETYVKVKHLLGNTLRQDTSKGYHFIYKFDPEIKKTLNKVMRDAGYDMEYRTEGAYIVVAPTSVNGEERIWNNNPIIEMPKELKDLFLQHYNKGVEEQTQDEEIQEAIINNDLKSTNLSGLDGCCNDTFIRFGGILRKKCNSEQVRYVLKHFNAMLADPMDNKALYGLINQIDRYQHYDKEDLAKTVLQRLEIIGKGTAFQIASSLKYEVKDVEEVFKYLEDQGKVLSCGNRNYELINDVEWTTETNDLSVPIDFEMPIFHDYAYFDWGNMIIIGGATGCGKTHLTGNIIQQLVEQDIKPYLINTEAGSKIGKITKQLGVPDNSFWIPKKPVKHPTDIELKDNAVTVIDWLKPKDGDYAKTDNTYEHLHNQQKKHGGILIILTQLRSSNNEFFAPDLVKHYGALVAKYLFGDNGKDSENTYFKTEKIRDSRTGKQFIEIPMYFNMKTKVLEKR